MANTWNWDDEDIKEKYTWVIVMDFRIAAMINRQTFYEAVDWYIDRIGREPSRRSEGPEATLACLYSCSSYPDIGSWVWVDKEGGYPFMAHMEKGCRCLSEKCKKIFSAQEEKPQKIKDK